MICLNNFHCKKVSKIKTVKYHTAPVINESQINHTIAYTLEPFKAFKILTRFICFCSNKPKQIESNQKKIRFIWLKTK